MKGKQGGERRRTEEEYEQKRIYYDETNDGKRMRNERNTKTRTKMETRTRQSWGKKRRKDEK